MSSIDYNGVGEALQKAISSLFITPGTSATFLRRLLQDKRKEIFIFPHKQKSVNNFVSRASNWRYPASNSHDYPTDDNDS